MDTEFLVVIVLGLLLIVGIIVAPLVGHRTGHECVVIAKSFVPGSVGTGVGPAIGSNGQVSTVVMTNVTSEKWVVIGRDEKGNVFHVDVEPADWARLETGAKFLATSNWTGYWFTGIPR